MTGLTGKFTVTNVSGDSFVAVNFAQGSVRWYEIDG